MAIDAKIEIFTWQRRVRLKEPYPEAHHAAQRDLA
jgi:hypothetical protein